ncbi:MAG: hypothetical protein ACYC7A_13500 [Thermoanaerobaculia bacterium]
MQALSRSCLLWTVAFIALVAGAYFYFRGLHGETKFLWPATIALAIFLMLVLSYATGIVMSLGERRILKAALAGERPADGRWAAISGHIQSARPLRAPISGLQCVFYRYEIDGRSGSGDHSQTVTYYEGKALAPSVITTNTGTYRLLAVPTLEGNAVDVEDELALRSVEEYIGVTAFETPQLPKDARTGVVKEWTDDDGEFRVDLKRGEPEVPLERCSFSEWSVPNGEMVCVFGLYSESRGGIVPHPNWSRQARLLKGSGEAGLGTLTKRVFLYTLGILIFTAAAWALVHFYELKVQDQVAGAWWLVAGRTG